MPKRTPRAHFSYTIHYIYWIPFQADSYHLPYLAQPEFAMITNFGTKIISQLSTLHWILSTALSYTNQNLTTKCHKNVIGIFIHVYRPTVYLN